MSDTWKSAEAPPDPRIGAAGWLRAGLRGAAVVLVILPAALLLVLLRLAERPLCAGRRPLTPYITQGVCRASLRLIGIGYRREGRPMTGPGAVVANHSSWLDIFTLNAGQRVCFVSKAEVSGWPGIGWLARITGTVFVKRDRREATGQVALFRQRLAAGDLLLFFPEGTSTDGCRVLPFKPTLFAAFLDPALGPDLMVQPVSVRYEAAPGADARQYGWWGEMAFGPHLLATLAARRQGRVSVTYHPPLRVADHADRKALSRAAEAAVRAGHVHPGDILP